MQEHQIPCIIEEGIICNFRDMQRVLRDLGHVRYVEFFEGKIRSRGEGYVMSVVSNGHSANIIAHKRLYLNVNGFEALKIATHTHETHFDLLETHRTLRLIPLTDPVSECLSAEGQEMLDDAYEYDEDVLAEIYGDDEDEDH